MATFAANYQTLNQSPVFHGQSQNATTGYRNFASMRETTQAQINLGMNSRQIGLSLIRLRSKAQHQILSWKLYGIKLTMKKLNQYLKVVTWLLNGKLVPPPQLIKQRILLKNARRFDIKNFVETGTLYGDMVHAMRNHFKKLYSIEISHDLALKAQARFRGNKNIEIIENDSAIALKTLVPQIQEPAVFWLDGHYSGGNTGHGETNTPIMQELAAILSSTLPHAVLIDDARCFGTEKDYPSLIQLETYIKTFRPTSHITIEHDCIQISP